MLGDAYGRRAAVLLTQALNHEETRGHSGTEVSGKVTVLLRYALSIAGNVVRQSHRWEHGTL